MRLLRQARHAGVAILATILLVRSSSLPQPSSSGIGKGSKRSGDDIEHLITDLLNVDPPVFNMEDIMQSSSSGTVHDLTRYGTSSAQPPPYFSAPGGAASPPDWHRLPETSNSILQEHDEAPLRPGEGHGLPSPGPWQSDDHQPLDAHSFPVSDLHGPNALPPDEVDQPHSTVMGIPRSPVSRARKHKPRDWNTLQTISKEDLEILMENFQAASKEDLIDTRLSAAVDANKFAQEGQDFVARAKYLIGRGHDVLNVLHRGLTGERLVQHSITIIFDDAAIRNWVSDVINLRQKIFDLRVNKVPRERPLSYSVQPLEDDEDRRKVRLAARIAKPDGKIDPGPFGPVFREPTRSFVFAGFRFQVYKKEIVWAFPLERFYGKRIREMPILAPGRLTKVANPAPAGDGAAEGLSGSDRAGTSAGIFRP